MRFALNYSKEAVELQQAGRIQVDLYKLPDWKDTVDEIRKQHPIYVHLGLLAGSPPKEPINWDAIEHFLKVTEMAYVNVHLGVWKNVIEGSSVLDLSPAMIDQVSEMIRADLQQFVTRFGADRIMGENLFSIDAKGEVMQAGTLPEVLTPIIEESGIGLLLDLAHAKMAAFALGIPVHEYIEALPVDRLRELHVTGIGYHSDGRLLDHYPMRADDWVLYEWAMHQIHDNPNWGTPAIVACEYGGIGPFFAENCDADIIAQQIPRMYQAVYPLKNLA